MSIKNKLIQMFLSRSNSYNFYKDNYLVLKKENKRLEKKHQKYIDTHKKDLYYVDFENVLAKFYVSPIIKAPFSSNDKRCFSFMDHLAKYISNSIDEQPLVSVIFPVYNYEEGILDLIDSVLNQTYNNFELIVVNDASSDNTLDILNSLNNDKIKLISNNEHKGLSYCRNAALNIAKGEYIFYIDMNNQWTPKYLKTMMGCFSMLPKAKALYSGQIIFNTHFEKVLGTVFGTYNKSLLYNNNFISLSALGHKREIVEKIHFDETVTKLEDWLFILEISKYFQMYSIPVLLSTYQFDGKFDKRKGMSEEYDVEDIKVIHQKVNNDILNNLTFNYELNRKISIVIPSYNLLNDLKECIDAILLFNSDLIDIIVVDNNSDKEVQDYLRKIYEDGKIKYIQNDINYGFTYAIEQGINISDEKSDILLLNNDAILQENSLESMQYYAYHLDDCGIVVPRQLLFGNDNRISGHIPYAKNDFECDVTPSIHHENINNIPLFFDGELLELKFAPFFCTYIPRDVYNQTIGLDSELGRHYRSDRIFCNFIRHVLNLKVYQISQAKVYHKSQKSTKKLKSNENEYNWIYSKNQWEPELAEKLGFKKSLWDI